MNPRILILGAGYAGLLCATRLARRLGDRGQVTLVGASDHFVERIRQHERLCGTQLAQVQIAPLLHSTTARFVRGTVEAIDLAGRRVVTSGATLGYDRLVLALGSATDTAVLPGVREHAVTLDDHAVAAAQGRVAQARRLLVCGGGLTGIECASELAARFPGAAVTLLTAGQLDEGLSSAGATHLRGALRRLGVSLIERTPVRALSAGQALLDQGHIPFDMCLWAGGFRASPLVAAAGLAVNQRGQALVDGRLRSTSHRDVIVVGDAAAPADVGSPIHMSCKTAMPMGAYAADSLVAELRGQAPTPFRFGDAGICISLGRTDGLIQPRRTDGSAVNHVFTGHFGALLKELVCRYTVWSLRMERRRLFWGYQWLRPALPAVQRARIEA